MRRLTVSAFAVLYAVLILSGSAEKAFAWAAKQSETLSHHDTKHAFHKTDRSESHLGQTKVTETESLVASPRTIATAPLMAARQTLLWIADVPLSRSSSDISSRAPPSLG